MTGPLLQVQDLCVHLRTRHGEVQALRDLSFTLERGQTLGLIGESGCGKSLTALALMGLLPEGSRVTGSVLLDGKELVNLPEAQMCALRGDRLSMVFQEPMTALNPVQRIGQQVAETLRLHRQLSASAAREQAVAMLERVGIGNAAQRFGAYPHEFSGGQRQRITLAMALVCGPDLLIADEPTTALDAALQKQILSLLGDLVRERNLALLLISHDLGLIAHNVQRMLVMYGGSAVESGPTASVFAYPAHPYTRGLLAARPRMPKATGSQGGRLATIPGQVPDLAHMPVGCPFAGRCAVQRDDCNLTRPSPISVGLAHQARCLLLAQPGGGSS